MSTLTSDSSQILVKCPTYRNLDSEISVTKPPKYTYSRQIAWLIQNPILPESDLWRHCIPKRVTYLLTISTSPAPADTAVVYHHHVAMKYLRLSQSMILFCFCNTLVRVFNSYPLPTFGCSMALNLLMKPHHTSQTFLLSPPTVINRVIYIWSYFIHVRFMCIYFRLHPIARTKCWGFLTALFLLITLILLMLSQFSEIFRR